MSLYWILAVTLLHCLSANPTKRDKHSATLYKETEDHINELKTFSCKVNDSTFYSPSGSEECTNKALDCSTLELEKLKEECFEDNPRNVVIVNIVRDSIKVMLNERNFSAQGNPNNCFCGKEKLEEKPYKEYLDNIKILLQRMNSKMSA